MGIKNLHPFLRKICPQVYREMPLSAFRFCKIAVDTSIYVCKFKTGHGKYWLDALLQFIVVLRENDIHPVFVFDSCYPMEKQEEKANRVAQRQRQRQRLQDLETLWEGVKQKLCPSDVTCTLPPLLLEIYQKALSDQHPDYGKPPVIALMDQEMERQRNALLSVRTEDFDAVRELLDILGVTHCPAIGEAEGTCAALVQAQVVDAALSEDTDTLAYGCPLFLHKLDTTNAKVTAIRYSEVLTCLRMTSAQFLDFCIMCGTDYNRNIPKIGPEKSYRLLQKFESLENLQFHCHHIDVSGLLFPRVRELFTLHFPPEEPRWKYMRCTGFPDTVKLSNFCFQHDLRTDLQRVHQAFCVSSHVTYPDDWQAKSSEPTSILALKTSLTV